MYLKTLNSCVGVSLLEKSSPVRCDSSVSNKTVFFTAVCCLQPVRKMIPHANNKLIMLLPDSFFIINRNLLPFFTFYFLFFTFHFLIHKEPGIHHLQETIYGCFFAP